MSDVKRIVRFVKPTSVRLTLTGGDWLDVRRELTVGEHRAAMARSVKSVSADGRFEADLEQAGKSEIQSYILDWSFCDEDGKRVAYSASALDALTVDAFTEIEQAIRAHIAAVESERGKSQSGNSSKSA